MLALAAPAAAQTPCDQAKVLADAGRTAEAVKVYAKALQSPATFACAKQGLTELKPKDESQSAWDWMETATKHLGTALAFLALLAAIGVAVWLAWKASGARQSDEPPRPRVKIDDFGSDDYGPGFSQLMRTELVESAWGDDRIDVITGQDVGKGALDALTSALPDSAKPLGAALTFLDSLSARPVLTISGSLYKPTALGGGASMLIADGADAIHATDLWAVDLGLDPAGDEAETMRRISIPAAAFIRHVYTNRQGPEPLMGSSAYGWALFRMAQSWHREGKYDNAKRLCESALQRDERNVLAEGLLGQILAQMPGNDALALEHLDAAIAALEGRDGG